MLPLGIKCDQGLLRQCFGRRLCIPGVSRNAMSYETVFEITHEAIPLWIPFMFVIWGLFGTIFYLGTRDSEFISKVFFRCFMLLFALLWVVFTSYYFLEQRHYVQAYQNGKYKVVEGPVEHYSWTGKHECFSVRGVEFCHGTANQVGWDPLFRLGPSTWPVSLTREGRPVRVAYSFDHKFPMILRLEIGSNSR
jgi:hypothetical protein